MKLASQMMNRCRSLGQPGGKECHDMNENATQAKPGLCRYIFGRILTMCVIVDHYQS
jgi:hypothetical protein